MPKPYSLNENVKQQIEKNKGDSVFVKPGEIYEAGKVKRFFLGDHYRDTWLTPVKVPVIDLTEAKGGLEILERGGGMQTYSLKLKGADGKLYSLRSIQKDPSPTLPKPLQYSFADDIVQDQISASHPLGAFILPPLAEAAGIYHTNPRLVYIPDTPALGKYRKEFGGVLAMIEEDADEDWSDYEDFGNTKNAVSTETVREDLAEDNDNWVDQKNLLRVRLFDMWVGDWDRHEGQFRWAELEGEDGKYYRPIPEDRDNVFFKFDGLIPWIVSRKWAMRKFRSFDKTIDDVIGLNQNAAHLDRRFLSELEEKDWIDVAQDLEQRMTDDVIRKAVRQLPDTIYALNGQFLEEALIARRAQLVDVARRYYHILAKKVDIHGSNQNEVVLIDYDDNGVNIKMYEGSDDGEKKDKIYERYFKADETKEIRIYTKEDEDFFHFSGTAKTAPRIRVIGGPGEDFYQDSSSVSGWGDNNFVYDEKVGTTISQSKELKKKLSNSLDIHRYDFNAFEYDYVGPTLFFGYNSDDGTYIGGGVVIKTHGFRKQPYASYQVIKANIAPVTQSWNFDYDGDFIKVIGDLGVNINAYLRAPNYFTNFHGFGNETLRLEESRPDDFYEVRYRDLNLYPGLTFPIQDEIKFKFGPIYRYVNVEDSQDKFIGTLPDLVDSDVFKGNHFTGARLNLDIRTTQSNIYPEKGIRWNSSMIWLAQLNNDRLKYANFESALSAYYTIEEPLKITFAARVGGASIVG
ncbi:MAG: hypothetical protein R3345_13095, partial [Fulvivirga sp.]|nr:hypothetical protein [Fulvivirga sp.]